MTVGIAPDVEVIVKDYLRGLGGAVAALNTRFVGETPKEGDRAASWVKVTELTAPDVDNTGHLIKFMVQLDFYSTEAGGIPHLKDMVRTVRAALLAGLRGQHGSDVVTDVRWLGGPRGTDPGLKHRDRQPVTVLVWAHG